MVQNSEFLGKYKYIKELFAVCYIGAAILYIWI